MTKIKGIYAASLSILNNDLTLNIDKTINHSKYLLKNGCHGVVLFGSTGQSQLISLPEKISLINRLSMEKNYNKYIIGTGLNSLVDTINFMKVSKSLNFNYFLIMPPAYYKYSHDEVFNYYSLIIQKISNCKIILYNFEKLSGYKFSVNCVKKLVEKFPKNIIGVKDSSFNLYKKLKIKNFSIFTGSDEKLLEGLNIGNSGIITATCNVTSNIARKVYDEYHLNIRSYENKKLCSVRKIFENFNLISSLHTFMREKDEIFENLLPPLSLLNEKNKKILFDDLSKLDFNIKY